MPLYLQDGCHLVARLAMSIVYSTSPCELTTDDQGGIVVVAPIGTKPVLGGNFNTVPAGTLSGFLISFNSTSAGALKLNCSAMEYNESPG